MTPAYVPPIVAWPCPTSLRPQAPSALNYLEQAANLYFPGRGATGRSGPPMRRRPQLRVAARVRRRDADSTFAHARPAVAAA